MIDSEATDLISLNTGPNSQVRVGANGAGDDMVVIAYNGNNGEFKVIFCGRDFSLEKAREFDDDEWRRLMGMKVDRERILQAVEEYMQSEH